MALTRSKRLSEGSELILAVEGVETQRHRVHRGRDSGILRVLCASVFFFPYVIWHPLSVFQKGQRWNCVLILGVEG